MGFRKSALNKLQVAFLTSALFYQPRRVPERTRSNESDPPSGSERSRLRIDCLAPAGHNVKRPAPDDKRWKDVRSPENSTHIDHLEEL